LARLIVMVRSVLMMGLTISSLLLIERTAKLGTHVGYRHGACRKELIIDRSSWTTKTT